MAGKGKTWVQQQSLIDNTAKGFFDVTTIYQLLCRCEHEYHYRNGEMAAIRAARFCRISSDVHSSPTARTSQSLDFNTMNASAAKPKAIRSIAIIITIEVTPSVQ